MACANPRVSTFPDPTLPEICLLERHLCGNSDLNLNTGLNVDDDLLDGLGGGKEVDKTLVDTHFVLIPGLRTLTVGGLTGRDGEGLGGKTDRSLDVEGLGAGSVDQLLAHLLERGDLARGEGDTDLVDLRALAEFLLGLLERHCGFVGAVRRPGLTKMAYGLGANQDLNFEAR